MSYICAGHKYNTFEEHVPAPYFRKSFACEDSGEMNLEITVCGFYELYLNGQRYTKCPLAPYISNPDDIVYTDAYKLPLRRGENVIGVWLGNGFVNNPGGYIWDFDKSPFRVAPSFSLEAKWTESDGTARCIVSDETFRTAPSPVTSDDYRFGVHYDARLEKSGWNAPGYDDSDWGFAVAAPQARGERRVSDADPIAVSDMIPAVSVTPYKDGYIYDFGVNTTGVCMLKIKGEAGQKVTIYHFEELLEDGSPDIEQIWFHRSEELWQRDKDIAHVDTYICRGGEEEHYVPVFTYHGFRYALLSGVTPVQAQKDTLMLLEMHSALKERGSFSCSDEMANKLQEITRRSDLSNFFYFPTDCPHREKNGWTADAALSAEHIMLNLAAEKSYREWMRNICAAQAKDGSLPGIVPTGGWGFAWGNGPAWDAVLVYLPYYVWQYRGETEIIRESANAIMSYLHYLTTRVDEDGLLQIGLGDWCPVGRDSSDYCAPLEFTDTVMAMDIADKAACLFGAVGMEKQKQFALSVAASFRGAVRDYLIDFDTMTAAGDCQTSQAMAVYYNVFTPAERAEAVRKLLEIIYRDGDVMNVGVLGGRVLFHVLARAGYASLAYDMITRKEYPSYGNWVERGATSLWESFQEGGNVGSRNHHFWGDISSWFIQYPAGIRYGFGRAEIAPCFVGQLTSAKAHYDAPEGRIAVKWQRDEDRITLDITAPEGLKGRIRLEEGCAFNTGHRVLPLKSGRYSILCDK